MASAGRIVLVGTSFVLYLIALFFLLAVANWYKQTSNGIIEHVAPYWKPEVLNFLVQATVVNPDSFVDLVLLKLILDAHLQHSRFCYAMIS